MAAGDMHTLVPGCPDFIWCQLEVSAPAVEQLRPFLAAAAGPGFIDWNPSWWSVYDRAYWLVRSAPRYDGRGPILADAARAVADTLSDRGARVHETQRNLAVENPTRVPLDLNSLVPIPQSVLDAGFTPVGERWLMEHWGTAAPLRRVTFAMETRSISEGRIRQVAVFRFIAENWAPWLALKATRNQWAELTLEMRCRYGGSANCSAAAARSSLPATGTCQPSIRSETSTI
jgi:hypothetical protein